MLMTCKGNVKKYLCCSIIIVVNYSLNVWNLDVKLFVRK